MCKDKLYNNQYTYAAMLVLTVKIPLGQDRRLYTKPLQTGSLVGACKGA